MPKQIPATELDAIVQVVGQFPNGAAVSEVRGALDIELSRRTLQRRLARLVEAGRLETFGEGRAQRYRVPGSPVPDEATPPATRETDDNVVGPPAAGVGDIQSGAEHPLQERHVCSPDLLATYQPNRTFYLDESTRCRLRELGTVTEGISTGRHPCQRILSPLDGRPDLELQPVGRDYLLVAGNLAVPAHRSTG